PPPARTLSHTTLFRSLLPFFGFQQRDDRAEHEAVPDVPLCDSVGVEGVLIHDVFGDALIRLFLVGEPPERIPPRPTVGFLTARRDRKSTRLNSSHVSI